VIVAIAIAGVVALEVEVEVAALEKTGVVGVRWRGTAMLVAGGATHLLYLHLVISDER